MKNTHTDVIIIGGGLVGLSLAVALGDAGVKVAVIEVFDPKKMDDAGFDGRVSAIAYGSRRMFEATGVWNDMAKHAGEILDIRIVDENSPLFLHYDFKDVGTEPMGHIIENRFLRSALFKAAGTNKNIKIFAPATYDKIEYSESNVIVSLDNKVKIEGKFLVAADGKNSQIRKQAGIKTINVDYKQTGIVCMVKHEKKHEGIAVEHFLPAGPFAILPMKGGNHSSLVWTEKSELAPLFMAMDDTDFSKQVEKRFGKWLGKLEVVGPRWNYPLTLTFADEYISQRMCLVGDSAHAIHPIAGQGFNLGLRDVAVLAELVADTKNLGLDIGGGVMLESYQRARRVDNIQMIAVTDSLNRLFSNNIMPIKLIRRLGLSAVNKTLPLKKLFMKHAMGVAGDTPKLMRGEKV